MQAGRMNLKTLLVAAALAALVLLGAGVAYATSSDSGAEEHQPTTGPGIEKAKRVALEYTKGGRVSGTEVGDEEGYYEVEVTRDDGSQVDVHLDRTFEVLSTPADHESPDGNDGSGDDGG